MHKNNNNQVIAIANTKLVTNVVSHNNTVRQTPF